MNKKEYLESIANKSALLLFTLVIIAVIFGMSLSWVYSIFFTGPILAGLGVLLYIGIQLNKLEEKEKE